ncbi:AAEL003329-PA [Aedes aegypti]|uniref:AAEL003329-PA n=1 Tax=Aedes aegypti TaxID=7159 RepID=Q17FN0_AEDAE|nr:AAEL003329-PA [Aedes aegypti]
MPLLVIREYEPDQADLVDQVIQNLHHRRIVQLDATLIGYTTWFYGIFFCQNLSSFQKLIELFTLERYDIVGYYTFVLIEASEAEVDEVFNTVWKLKLLRTVLIVVNGDHPQLFNYSPYSNNTCGEPIVHRVQEHSSTELFIHFLNDFYGCPLKLGTFESPPFVHILSADQGRDSLIDGFEGDLVSTLAGKLNFRLVVMTPPDNAQWGVPSPNGSTGLMRILQDETVDFGVGCLGIMAQRNEILQPGRAHYNSRALFAIPEGQPYSPIEKLLRPFERTVWMVLVGQLISIAFLMLCLKFASDNVRNFIYGEGNQTALLNLFNVVYSGGLHIFPRRNFARTLLVLWIVHCFVLRTVYQGLLFRYLQDDSSHSPVDTVDGIERSTLYYHINKNSDRFFQHNPSLLKRVRYIPPGNDSMGAALDAVASRRVRDGVVLVTLEHIAYHNKHRLSRGFLRSTRDSLNGFPMVIYYPKRTFLVRVLNRVIGNIETAGLMNYWVRRYGNYHFLPAKLTMVQPKPLELQHVMGCFLFICVQWSMSCAVFGLELLSSRVAWLQRVLQFFVHR